jgi:hypothetical protein
MAVSARVIVISAEPFFATGEICFGGSDAVSRTGRNGLGAVACRVQALIIIEL